MRTSGITSLTRKENGGLLKALDGLLRQGASFTQRIKHGQVSYMYYGDVFEFINAQLDLIESARELCLTGRYRASLITTRAILEHYLAARLVGEATKYALRVKKKAHEQLEVANARLKREVLDARSKGRQDILAVRTVNNELYLVFDGPFANGKRAKENRVSYYYSVFNSYDPDFAYLPQTILKRQWYWGVSSPKKEMARMRKNMIYHKGLKSAFMSFDRLLFHNKINGFLTSKEETRMRVHYNFLSHFVHPTEKSIELLRANSSIRPYIKRISDCRHYDFAISHLILLYLSFISLMFCELQHRVVESAAKKYMKGIRSKRLVNYYKQDLLEGFGYFWFIYHGAPHEIVKFNQLVRQLGDPKLGINPNFRTLPDDKVSYYRDPLQHLHSLGGSWMNKILGSVQGPLVGHIDPFRP